MELDRVKIQQLRDALSERHPVRALLNLLLLAAAAFFGFVVDGCDFLCLVLLGTGLALAVIHWLRLWETWNPNVKGIRIAVSIFLVLVLIAVCATLVPILKGPSAENGSSDYVIVLGAGVKGTEPSRILQDRINRAYEYLSDHPDAICIASGGKGDDEDISEAQCIYDHLTAMGIDGQRIWLEDQATSTIENFRYSIVMIQNRTGSAPQQVTVLSNEFHLYRASRMAKDCGLEAAFVAAPTSNVFIRISYTVREVFALWKYLIMGG